MDSIDLRNCVDLEKKKNDRGKNVEKYYVAQDHHLIEALDWLY